MNEIMVVMGSMSDYPVVQNGLSLLEEFNIGYITHICSAHKSPFKVDAIIKEAEESNVNIIIAAAGMAAHLPGVLASRTLIPVIGVPLSCGLLGQGLDSLLSIVQMPSGIPVACMSVGVPGIKNAVLYAIQILAIRDNTLLEQLSIYRAGMETDIEKKDQRLPRAVKLSDSE